MKKPRPWRLNTEEKLFDKFVECEPNSGCWLWVGTRDPGNYGVSCHNYKLYKAHRLFWTFRNGPIPEKMHVLHKCDTPPCVNPDHLWLGTHQDNITDMMLKGRQGVNRGTKNGNAKLTEADVQQIRERYAQGGIRQVDLGKQFNVTQVIVSEIVLRKIWRHVP
jgi:hypothetical protein